MQFRIPLACAAIVSLVACAEGSDLVDGGGGSLGQGGNGESTSEAASTTVASSSTGAGFTSSSSGAGGSGEGGAGEGGDASASSSSSSSTGGGTATCATPVNGPTTPTDLGSIAGDENDPPIVVEGTSEEWFKVKISEESSSIFEEDMSFTVTLSSPAGMDYDLWVHQGQQGGAVNCTVTPQQGTGTPETLTDSWDDDQGLGGEDDSVWLCIEVRHVSGTACTDDFVLTIDGR